MSCENPPRTRDFPGPSVFPRTKCPCRPGEFTKYRVKSSALIVQGLPVKLSLPF